MSLAAKIRRAPQRAVTGAFILNTGLEKLRSADEDQAKGIHGLASGAYPALGNVDPKVFIKVLGAGEVALGGALLLPIVPAAVAGLGLAAFAGGMLTVYWRTPGMHRPDDVRPTQQGTAIAKDVWLFGIGSSLVIDSLLNRADEKKSELKGAIKGAKKGAQVAHATTGAAADARMAMHSATDSARVAGAVAAVQTKERARAARKQAAEQTKHAVESAREIAHSVKERVA